MSRIERKRIYVYYKKYDYAECIKDLFKNVFIDKNKNICALILNKRQNIDLIKNLIETYIKDKTDDNIDIDIIKTYKPKVINRLTEYIPSILCNLCEFYSYLKTPTKLYNINTILIDNNKIYKEKIYSTIIYFEYMYYTVIPLNIDSIISECNYHIETCNMAPIIFLDLTKLDYENRYKLFKWKSKFTNNIVFILYKKDIDGIPIANNITLSICLF